MVQQNQRETNKSKKLRERKEAKKLKKSTNGKTDEYINEEK